MYVKENRGDYWWFDVVTSIFRSFRRRGPVAERRAYVHAAKTPPARLADRLQRNLASAFPKKPAPQTHTPKAENQRGAARRRYGSEGRHRLCRRVRAQRAQPRRIQARAPSLCNNGARQGRWFPAPNNRWRVADGGVYQRRSRP